MILQLNHTYAVRDPEYCAKNGFITQDMIISVDHTRERDFIGASGEGYYRDGSIYGIYQKWEMDLVRDITGELK